MTRQTVRDVREFGDRLWAQGHYCQGDLQGLVDAQGRWRPIDFQTYGRITEFDADGSVIIPGEDPLTHNSYVRNVKA